MKSMRIKWFLHVACMRRKRDAKKFGLESRVKKDYLVNAGLDEKVLFSSTLKEAVGRPELH